MKKIGNKILIQLLLLLARFPMSFLYIISKFLYFILYKVIKYRLKVVKSNLKRCYPNLSEQELIEIEKKYYVYLSELIVESVKGFKISAKEMNQRINTKNLYIYDEIFDKKESAIVAMGHNGNWEWICRHAPLIIKTPIYVAYKPLSNPYFEKLMNKARQEFGINTIPMASVGRFILENKNQNFLLILTADQSPSNFENSIWVDFFNTKTSFLPGLEKLSLKYNLPIIFHEVKQAKKGYYECLPQILIQKDSKTNKEGEITQQYATFLEQKINEQIHTWVWSHKRWKHEYNKINALT